MAPNLLTPAEHTTIKHTTEVMVAYGLSYCLEEGGPQQQQAAGSKPGMAPDCIVHRSFKVCNLRGSCVHSKAAFT